MSGCALQCQCDRCLGYSCEPDQVARLAVEMVPRPDRDKRRAKRAAMRHWLQLGLEPAADERSLEKWLLGASESELDALERRAS